MTLTLAVYLKKCELNGELRMQDQLLLETTTVDAALPERCMSAPNQSYRARGTEKFGIRLFICLSPQGEL
jgi:hypothetical protein